MLHLVTRGDKHANHYDEKKEDDSDDDNDEDNADGANYEDDSNDDNDEEDAEGAHDEDDDDNYEDDSNDDTDEEYVEGDEDTQKKLSEEEKRIISHEVNGWFIIFFTREATEKHSLIKKIVKMFSNSRKL